MKTSVALIAFVGIAIVALWQLFWRTNPRLPQEGQPMEGTINAPDFPEGLQWLNTDRPLSLRELRGKVVLLDFWTYCCINCMHILPDLKRLERKYADSLVVIGVHSAKFFTEQETENIRQAILRYDIEHPVVNDNQMIVWQQYAVRAWPTLVLIDPSGKIVGYHSGEGIYEIFDRAIEGVIRTAEAKGTLKRGAPNFRLERDKEPRTALRFPGKVLADERTNRLFIADSNHHRILVVSLKDNRVEMVIGAGTPGLRDGAFEAAQFNNPQGMAYDPDADALYIADTDNHAIRKADLRKRTVETLAGTGEQSRAYPPRAGKGREIALNSPWDLVLLGDTLYIAMAGSHQLWRLNLKTLEAEPHAGTGREACIDGSLRTCALAQPSGITTDGKKLYFADSEVSCIRAADIDPNGMLETLVGGDLFEFGDVDGFGREARLQHPLGVVYVDGMLYVADTYNNKIKRLDPRTRKIETVFGTGAAGARDGDAPTFDEPGGITYAHGKLYIADTNNHLIRVADLKTRRVETLVLKGSGERAAARVAPRAAQSSAGACRRWHGRAHTHAHPTPAAGTQTEPERAVASPNHGGRRNCAGQDGTRCARAVAGDHAARAADRRPRDAQPAPAGLPLPRGAGRAVLPARGAADPPDSARRRGDGNPPVSVEEL
jgi:thiol-disulfide isomerase/thioredoxin